MKKKILLFSTISMLIGICIEACSNTNDVHASNNDDFKMEFIDEYYDIELWKDTETGVEYFIYSDHIGYGAAGGMCPRYNTDGTLYVD